MGKLIIILITLNVAISFAEVNSYTFETPTDVEFALVKLPFLVKKIEANALANGHLLKVARIDLTLEDSTENPNIKCRVDVTAVTEALVDETVVESNFDARAGLRQECSSFFN